MANLILRLTKGSPLTHAELDANFTLLDDEIHIIEADVIALQNLAVQFGSTAPVTNADGTTPIVNGAQWWNSVLNSLNVWDGTQWVDVGSSVATGNISAPPSPATAGDTFYDSTTTTMYAYDGTNWFPLGSVVPIQAAAPTPSVAGDLWYDTTTGSLRVYDGANWISTSGGGWLSAKAADPNVRDDSTPLQQGDTYYNTSDDTIYSWDGSSWIQVSGGGDNLGGLPADPAPMQRADGSPLQVGDTYFNTTTNELMVYDGAAFVSSNVDVISDLDDVDTTGVVAGDRLVYDGTNWVATGNLSVPNGPTGGEPGTPALGDLYFDTTLNELMVWDGGAWSSVNVDVISDLDDVDTTGGIVAGQALVWDGANWVPGSGGSASWLDAAATDPATRPDTTAIQHGDTYFNTTDNILYSWDGGAWIQMSSGTTLGGKAADPATRNDGSPLQAGDTYYNTTTGEQMVYDGAWKSVNVDVISDLDDVDTTGVVLGDHLVYDGANWVPETPSTQVVIPSGPTGSEPSPAAIGDMYFNTTTQELMVHDGTSFVSANVDVISDLDDVDTTGGAANGQALVWNGVNWVPGSGGSASWLDAAAAAPATRPDTTAIQHGDTYFNTTDNVMYSWDAPNSQWIQMSGGSTLGGLAADPGTRNDGSTLEVGDTYFNTTTGEQMVWDGGAWKSVNVDVISDLDDVDTTGVLDGDHLVYDGASSTWIPQAPSTNVTIPSGPTGSEPASPVAGDLYFDTTLNELVIWNGSAWASSNADVISDLDDVDTTGVALGDHLVYDGANWVPETPSTNVTIPTGPTGSEPTPVVAGDLYFDSTLNELMVYDGGTWISANVDVISDLDDVDTTGVANGDHLVFNGTNWVPKASNDGAVISPQNPAPTQRDDSSLLQEGDQYYDTVDNKVYFYDGGAWVSPDITINSVTFDSSTTVPGGNLTIVLNDAAATTFTVDMDGRYAQTVSGVLPDANGNVPVSLSDVQVGTEAGRAALGTPAQGTVYVVAGDPDPTKDGKTSIFNANDGNWYDVVGYDQASLDARYINTTEGIGSLSDVDTTTTPAATDDILQFDGTNWVNVTPNTLVLGSIDQHSDVDTTTTAPVATQTLVWNGTNWVPSDVIASSVINGPTGSEPTPAALGDLYYDTTTNELMVYDGGAWSSVNADVISDLDDVDTTGAVAGDHFVYDGAKWVPETPSTQIVVPTGPTGSEPTTVVNGDLYYDTTTSQLMVYSGGAWVPAVLGAQYIDELLDVDTSTVAATSKTSYLVWDAAATDGTNVGQWVPSDFTDGSPTGGASDDF